MPRLNAAALFFAMLTAQAAIAQVPAGEKPTIENSLNAGLSLTDGNSETMRATASILSAGEQDTFGSYRVGVEVNYGESRTGDTKDSDVDNGKFFGNAKRTLSSRTFASLDLTALYDHIAEVDYRVTAGPGVGAYLVKSSVLALSVECGPSYLWEKVAGLTDDYVVLRITERLDWKISDTAKAWESVQVLPRIDDFGNSLLTAEVGIEAAINSRMSLRLVLEDKYDSEPADGLKENDLSLIAGLGVKL